jgi:multidrug efflux pump
LSALEAVARETLPPGFTTAWSGLAYEETQSGGTSALAFALGLVVVFLVLAAQYESWRLPLAVMTAIPFGVLGALAANHLRGLQNDVYFQIGLLVLIGLGAKNAILRVTAAVDLRRQGRDIMQATIEAGEQRLRPIIMTSLAFGVGVLPLVIAMGAGANARHSIGTGILGGMIGETTLAMLYVPVFFYLLERFTDWWARRWPKPLARPDGHEPAAPGPDAGQL